MIEQRSSKETPLEQLELCYNGKSLDYLFRCYGEMLNLCSLDFEHGQFSGNYLAEQEFIQGCILNKPLKERIDFWHDLCERAWGVERKMRNIRDALYRGKEHPDIGPLRELLIELSSRRGVFEREFL
jgi:hypothetical protein